MLKYNLANGLTVIMSQGAYFILKRVLSYVFNCLIFRYLGFRALIIDINFWFI
jgi:hypothetical protein